MPRESTAVTNYKARLRTQKQKHKPKNNSKTKTSSNGKVNLPEFQTKPKKGAKRSRVTTYTVVSAQKKKTREQTIRDAHKPVLRTPHGLSTLEEFCESIDDLRDYQQHCEHPALKLRYLSTKKVEINDRERVEISYACGDCAKIIKEVR